MIYYIVAGHIFTIFLSLNHLTSIGFPDKVQEYVGGHEGEFKIYQLNKKRHLIIEPKKKEVNRNFLAFLAEGKYHFNLSYREDLSNKDIEIREAVKCSHLTLIKEVKEYQLYECPRSLFFVNKTKKPVKVNELSVLSKSYLSKGPPIYVEGKMVYYQGRVL